jgi:hypothetical protein
MNGRGVLRIIEGGELAFWCPGCLCVHALAIKPAPSPSWEFDGNYDRPTFSPSVLIRTGHYVPGAPRRPDGKCGWCEDARENGHATLCSVCHSFVKAGSIQFLADCTHALRGQTVAIGLKP